MPRRLSAEERALWRKVVDSVRPLHAPAAGDIAPTVAAEPRPPTAAKQRPMAKPVAAPRKAVPGTTLDGSWDKQLTRGLASPDAHLDLHGHNLATAHALLDERLERAIAAGARLLLLVTGKPRGAGAGPRGAIRAAVGDWLAASRHAANIAAVRNAHPRHGGAGALYIVLRRRRERP